MNKLKQVFSSSDSHSNDSTHQRRASGTGTSSSPRQSLDAKSKNDELAARLGGGSPRHSQSGTQSGTSADKAKSEAKNVLADHTASSDSHAAQREQPLSGTGSGAGYLPHGATSGSHSTSRAHDDAVRKNDELAAGLNKGHQTSLDPSQKGSPEYSANQASNNTDSHHSTSRDHSSTSGLGAAGAGAGGLAGAGLASRTGHTTGDTSMAGHGLTNNSHIGNDNTLVSDSHNSAAPPRLERTGTGRLGKKLSGKGFGDDAHSHGHVADNSLHNFDHTKATHDHQHLQHVTHRDVRHVEVEEVLREREHDRHIHHVQHHVQPILDKVVQDEVHHDNAIPITKIHERHTSTDEDRSLYMSLGANHKDTETHRAKERTIIDLGERVHENIHHHVHHVTQPIIEQEVVDRHRIHTIIPVHHVTHEAPIIHKSSVHEHVALADFLKGGGKLDSQITSEKTGLISTGECERSVDGVGADLFSKLGLQDKSGIFGSHSHGTPATTAAPRNSVGSEGYSTSPVVPTTGHNDHRSSTGPAAGIKSDEHFQDNATDSLTQKHNYDQPFGKMDAAGAKEYRTSDKI